MKNKFFSMIILLFLILQTAHAHRQHVHQYFVREGYKLLQLSIGGDVPNMVDHVGLTEGSSGPYPWSSGLISAGAWGEDENDPIWHWSGSNPTPITGTCPNLLNELCSVFDGCGTNPYVSSTHFWNPDNGDDGASDLEGTLPVCGYFKLTASNAYQKFLLYANGGWDIDLRLAMYCFPNRHDGTGCCANQIAMVTLHYNSLVDLYKNRNIYVTKVTWMNNDYVIYDQPIKFENTHWSSLNGITYNEFIDNIAWEALGRMAHLLGDMSIPAHTRCDIHGSSVNGIFNESVEDWFGYDYNWNADNIFETYGSILNPYVSDDPLHFLMYTTAQISNYFGSNGPYNGNGNSQLLGNSRPEEIAYLTPIIGSLATVVDGKDIRIMRSTVGDISVPMIKYIRDHTFDQAIRATAGLFSWFAVETGLLNQVSIKNSFENGFIKINSVEKISGFKFPVIDNQDIIIEAIDLQNYNNHIWHFANWKQFKSNIEVASTLQSQWVRMIDHNYSFIATFNQEDNVSVSQPLLIEGGTVGNYRINNSNQMVSTWSTTYVEHVDPSIIIEAIPPSSEYFLFTWQDDSGYLLNGDGSYNNNNPMVLTPTDHVNNLHAVFKKHLFTSSITGISNNNQRKYARWGGALNNPIVAAFGNMFYESGNTIFLAESNNGSSGWKSEVALDKLAYQTPNNHVYRGVSIQADQNSDIVNIVWENVLQTTQTNWEHTIEFKGSNDNEYNHNNFTITNYSTTSGLPATPVLNHVTVNSTFDYYFTVWRAPTCLRFKINSGSYQHENNIPGTSSNSTNPSIVAEYKDGPNAPNRLFVVWEEGGNHIYLSSINFYSAAIPNNWNGTPISLDEDASLPIKGKPSMVRDNDGNICIAWEARNITTGVGKIKFQKRNLSGNLISGSEREFITCLNSGTFPSSPQLTHHMSGSNPNDLTMVWNKGNGDFVYTNYSSSQSLWSMPKLLVSTVQDVSISESMVSGDNKTYAVAVSISDPPYQLQILQVPSDFTTPLEITTLTTPADNASGIPISNTFQWNAAPGATAYTLQVALDENFSNIFGMFTNITETQKEVSGLAYSTIYYWRVQATNCPAASNWSDVRKCTTEVAMPQQITPANNATNVGTPLTLRWNSINNAVSYRIQIDNDTNFTPTIFKDISGLTDTSYTPTGLSQNTKYYWRVYAVNGMGATILPSIRSFTSGGIPSAPLLVTPMEEAFNVTSPVTFSWNAVSGAQTYHLFYSPDPNFEDGVSHLNNLTATSVTVGINFTGTCYWHVFAINTYGSAASDDWSFNIVSGFAAPTFNGANYTSGGITYPKLYWTRVSQATNYKLYRYYCNNSGSDCENYMQQTLIYSGNDTVVIDYSLFVGASSSNSRGYYYVKAYKADGTSSAKSSKRWYYTQLDSKTSFRPDQDDEQLPLANKLLGNFPNPFNPTTTIYYNLAEDSHVKIVVVNTLGVEVATLIDEYVSAGYKSASFDASNLPSGVYFYRMQAGQFSDMKKMLLLK